MINNKINYNKFCGSPNEVKFIKKINKNEIGLFNKDTKTICIKETSKRKSHKRKIEIIKKKPIDKIKLSKVEKIVCAYENSIKDGFIETCGLFDENGKMIFNKDGNSHSIDFTKNEQKKFKGMIFTHNHPKGYSLSMGDIIYAGESKMKEVRCISKSNSKTYSIKMKDGSNFRQRFTFSVLYSKALKYDKIVYKENMERVDVGEVKIWDINQTHWDQVWKKVANDVPEIIYKGD